jgi:hypothetical protein
VHIAARDAERGVMLPDGLLVRALEEAVHLAVRVVIQLDLADAESVRRALARP